MEPTLYRFIFRYSLKQQISLLILTLVSFPFLYYSLELPKLIINEAISGTDFPRTVFGYDIDQVSYLMLLCAIFLALVLINGLFKYVVNVYRGVVGERMLRRLRYLLLTRVLRFPLPQFRKLSQGEIVSMVTAETEPLGGYIGDSVALPAFQGGILLTILGFMFVQDTVLGTAAIALYPLQGWLIPKLQRQVNLLKKDRVVRVRKLSERIGEAVTGVQEIHTHDTSQYELADFSDRIGTIFDIRYQIYRKKFFIKFLNNFLAQITPFFFFSIGGYLVIRGELSFGALVAVLAAYKDLSSPWKELLNFYQLKEDARIKYDLLIETFQPPGMLDEALLTSDVADSVSLRGELVVTNVDLAEEEGDTSSPGTINVKLTLPGRYALVATTTDSGADRLARVLAGLQRPRGGTLRIAELDLGQAPEAITGRRIAYAGPGSVLISGTVRDNLVYSLKHRPTRAKEYQGAARGEHERWLREARLSGNSEHDRGADWIDYAGAGIAGPEVLSERAIEVLRMVDMEADIYQLGLQGNIDPQRCPDLAGRILEARAEVRERLQDPQLAPLVELFDRDAYNHNLSVAENLLFGTPRDRTFDVANLGENAYVRKVLHETGLMPVFLDIGRQVAAIMVDLFADVEPGSELFEQFAFIDADDLPEFRTLLARVDPEHPEALDALDRRKLISLPFKLVTARHRLGLIDEKCQTRLLEARRMLAQGFGGGRPSIEFFDVDRVNPAISIQDNILFGRLAYGKARSAVTIGAVIREIVDRMGLRRDVMEVGLDYPVGIGGSRLNVRQRQKLALGRCVLKRPDLLVVDQALDGLDEAARDRIMQALLDEFVGRSLIWVLQRASLAEQFDRVLVMEGGRIVEQGTFTDLAASDGPLQRFIQAT